MAQAIWILETLQHLGVNSPRNPRFDGTVWSVVPNPNPGAQRNILFGVAARHALTEHWNGSAWSVVNAVDAGANGNQFYAVKALVSRPSPRFPVGGCGLWA